MGPPVYGGAGAEQRSSSVKRWCHSFVNEVDVVPRLSVGNMARLLQGLKEVDASPLTLPERVAIVVGDSPNHARLPDLCELPDDVRTKLGEPATLQQIGTIILVRSCEPGQGRCEELTPPLCNNVLLDTKMIDCHKISNYTEGIAASMRSNAAASRAFPRDFGAWLKSKRVSGASIACCVSQHGRRTVFEPPPMDKRVRA